MAKKKKQYVEEQIFSIYSDFPVLVNDYVVWSEEEAPMHFHYYLEIGYCMEGSGSFCSDNRVLEVQQDDITIAAPNMLHVARADEGVYTRFANIYLDLSPLIKLFPGGETKLKLQMVQESFCDVLCMEGKMHPDILWIIKEIIRLNHEKKQNYKMQIMGLLYTMIFKIHDAFAEDFPEKKSFEDLPILPAIDFILDHYMEPIKVAQLAKVCHFSESYFRKVFLEMKGIGPMDYVNSIRIRAACRMLINTTDTVRVIGEKCGYPSVTTFERNFRQRTGMLPSQWRESQKNPRKKDRDTYKIKRVYYKDNKES